MSLMKRTIALVLIMIMSLITSVGAVNAETRLQTTAIATEIKAVGMPLQELLDLLTRSSGIELVAVPEVSDLKVDLLVKAEQTVASVLAALQEKYGLMHKLNPAKTAVVLLKGDYVTDRMFGGKGIMLATKEMNRMPMAVPSPGVIRPSQPIAWNTEEYKNITDNSFQNVSSSPLSTFSIDIDTASYSNVRRFLNSGNLPPADAVRTEELLNYFTYDYPQPTGEQPISLTTEVAVSPWNSSRKLVMLGIQGKQVKTENLPPSNLVFLIDVSGSMYSPNKLPLLKTAFKMLVQQLRPQDRVAIVVYAGAAGMVLESTPGSEKAKITAKIEGLQAGGSTAGGEGIKLAYKIAKETFIEGGNNRVILATDGDFNVGASSEGELVQMIEERRDQGISLTVLGFGMGNIKDNKMEALADKGNGNYAYIDNALEAKKVLVSQMAGTLFTIAKDVKIQVEFNPATVKSYRLIGYENRKLADRDFNDDQKDAGDMGAGHSVTAIYEIVPADSLENVASVDPLVYQQSKSTGGSDWLQVKIRYKKPGEETSQLMTQKVDGQAELAVASENLRFAAAVVEYGMLLRNSEFKGQASYQQALALARGARGNDENGYRAEFIKLLEISQILDAR
jgi:Ca-activated chloride channel family protein